MPHPLATTGDASVVTRDAQSSRPRWTMTCLSLCMLLPSLDTSIANTSLPTLAKAFGSSFQQVQWVVLAYLLAITTLIVSAGRIGDLMGRRRTLLFGIGCFTVASALCSVSAGLGWLIAARAGQGLGAAIMMALTLASVSEAVPADRTGRAMGLLGTMSAIGTALGPSLGGVLVAACGWRSIFLVNVPLGIAALLLAYRHLPQPAWHPHRTGVSGLDPAGTVLLASTLAAYALAMTLGRGHFGLLNASLLLGACAGTAMFAWMEARVTSPLIRLPMLRVQTLSAGLVMSALVSAVMMTTLVVGPFYLSRALGMGPALVGAILSSGPCVSALSGVPAGRLADRLGAHRTTILGLAGIAVGTLALSLLTLLSRSLGAVGYMGPVAIATVGYALFQASNNTNVMTGVPADQRGVISGMLSLSRNLGLVTGASVMGGIFAIAVGTSDMAEATPDAVAFGMRVTFGVAAGLIAMGIGIALGVGLTPSRGANPPD